MKKMYIFTGFDMDKPSFPKQLLDTSREIEILLRHGLNQAEKKRKEPKLLFTNTNRSLQIGSSAQDVLSELGSPSAVYFKENDKMKIHAQPENKADEKTIAAGVRNLM